MGAPVLIGAGIGAVTSLATGRDPLTGAVLGGVTGGTFGGDGGLFSGFNQGGLFGSAIPDAVGSQALTDGVTGAAFEQAITPTDQLMLGVGDIQPQAALDTGFGVQIPNESIMSTNELVGATDIVPQSTGFGVNVGEFTQPTALQDLNRMNTSNLLGAPQQSFLEKVQSIPNPFSDMTLKDQVGLSGMTLEAMSPTQQEQAQQVIQPKRNAGKPLNVDQTGTGILDVKVPEGFLDTARKNQIRSLFYK